MTEPGRRPPAWAAGAVLAVVALEALFTTAAAPLLLDDTESRIALGALFAAPAIAGAGGIAYTALITRNGRLGLRPGAAALTVGLAAMAVAPNWQSLAAGRLVAAFGGSMAVSSAYALVTADGDAGRRGRLVGIIGIAISLPAVALPLLYFLMSRASEALAFGGLALAAFVALLSIPETAHSAPTPALRTASGPEGCGDMPVGAGSSPTPSIDPKRPSATGDLRTWVGALIAIACLWTTSILRGWGGVAVLILGLTAGARLILNQITAETSASGFPRLALCARALAIAAFFGVDILLPFYLIDELSLSAPVGAAAVVTSALGWAISSAAFPSLQRSGHVVAVAQLGSVAVVAAIAAIAIIAANPTTEATTAALMASVWFVAGAGTGALSCASTELAVGHRGWSTASTGPALQMIDAASIAVGTGLAGFLISRLELPATVAVFLIGAPACLAALGLHDWARPAALASGRQVTQRIER